MWIRIVSKIVWARVLGGLKFGVKGDVLVACEVCTVACQHCRRVIPIRGCILKYGGMNSQHHSALFRGMED